MEEEVDLAELVAEHLDEAADQARAAGAGDVDRLGERLARRGVPDAHFAATLSVNLSGARHLAAAALLPGGAEPPFDADAAVDGARRIMVERTFGEAGDRVVVEECLVGREASFFVLVDGERAKLESDAAAASRL